MCRCADDAERSGDVRPPVRAPRQAGHSVTAALRQRQARPLGSVAVRQPVGVRRAARLARTSSFLTYLLFICRSVSRLKVALLCVKRRLKLRLSFGDVPSRMFAD